MASPADNELPTPPVSEEVLCGAPSINDRGRCLLSEEGAPWNCGQAVVDYLHTGCVKFTVELPSAMHFERI